MNISKHGFLSVPLSRLMPIVFSTQRTTSSLSQCCSNVYQNCWRITLSMRPSLQKKEAKDRLLQCSLRSFCVYYTLINHSIFTSPCMEAVVISFLSSFFLKKMEDSSWWLNRYRGSRDQQAQAAQEPAANSPEQMKGRRKEILQFFPASYPALEEKNKKYCALPWETAIRFLYQEMVAFLSFQAHRPAWGGFFSLEKKKVFDTKFNPEFSVSFNLLPLFISFEKPRGRSIHCKVHSIL